jgi:hypothetical protein
LVQAPELAPAYQPARENWIRSANCNLRLVKEKYRVMGEIGLGFVVASFDSGHDHTPGNNVENGSVTA